MLPASRVRENDSWPILPTFTAAKDTKVHPTLSTPLSVPLAFLTCPTKVPTSEEDLSFNLNLPSFPSPPSSSSLQCIELLLHARHPNPVRQVLRSPPLHKGGDEVDWVGEKEERLISAAPLSLNGKTPDTRGTSHSGFATAKEKMFSGYAPPSPLPRGTDFLGRPCSQDTTGFPVLK